MPKFQNPTSYAGRKANKNLSGQSRFATDAEAAEATAEDLMISPATLSSAVGDLVPSWSETVSGIGQLSTSAEATTGTNDDTAMTPLKVAAVFAAPPAIGSGTPAAGSFSTISATGRCVFTPDSITSDNAGVAASVSTFLTLITTDGDSNLDNVTLANGVAGQVKMFAVVVAGNAADSIKITPANMAGGTQITFAADPTGLGCTMCFDGTNWAVVANNGGTIS